MRSLLRNLRLLRWLRLRRTSSCVDELVDRMDVIVHVKSHWVSISVMALFIGSVEIFNFNVAWRRFWFWLRLRLWLGSRCRLGLRFWLRYRFRFWLLQILKSI